FTKAIQVKLHNIHTSLLKNGELISSEILKAKLLGKTDKQKTVLMDFDHYLKYNGNSYSTATSKKYGYCRDHLKNFIWKTYQATDIFLTRVAISFIKQYQLYLLTENQFHNEAGMIVRKIANDHNSTLKYLNM